MTEMESGVEMPIHADRERFYARISALNMTPLWEARYPFSVRKKLQVQHQFRRYCARYADHDFFVLFVAVQNEVAMLGRTGK